MRYTNIVVLICSVLIIVPAIAQQDFYHPELEWKTIETKHFLVHFHNGSERTGHETAKIAESVYGPITTMYGYEPDQRVSLIIRDHDDLSNGAAYFYENRIEILAPAMDFEFRGTHPWLWNVISHEFTHIIQIQTAMKFGRKFPGFYLQWLGYEQERRPDVLYGYPNVIASYPISGFVVPIWFAEGTAQYNNPSLGFDYWDSHRDMILRMYMAEGNPLSWEEMSVFGKTGLGNESSYNAGFSIVGYIGRKYGPEKLQEISRNLGAPLRLTIDGAIESALGISGEQLYQDWKTERTEHYQRLKDSLHLSAEKETFIEPDGFGNYYPVFSPDGSKIAYVTNKGRDYLSLSSVELYDLVSRKYQSLPIMTRSSLSFSPDGKFLYYSQITEDNPHWSRFSDLYRFEIETGKEERLTYGLRAINPKLSQDGKRIVFSAGSDGTQNVLVCTADGKNITPLTGFKNGEQAYTPVWSPDGKKIAFGYSLEHNQSMALINSDGTDLKILPKSGDCRNPFFASDSVLYYSWNKNGIFNIYSYHLSSKSERQETNVLGGAFLPAYDAGKGLCYVTYTSSGYKIALDSCGSAKPVLDAQSVPAEEFQPFASVPPHTDLNTAYTSGTVKGIGAFPADTVIRAERPYKPVFTSISLIPFLRFDTYTESSNILDQMKPGLYFTSSEVLNKMNVFGGAAINRKWERDLFLTFEYAGRLPLLYDLGFEPIASVELYNISRTRDVSFELSLGYPYGFRTFYTDVVYSLFELDLSLRQNILSERAELKLMYVLSRYNQDFGSWDHPAFAQPIPASRSTYFIGNTFSAQVKYNGILRTLDKDINPIGRTLSLKYFYESDKYNPKDSAEYKDGFRVPVFTPYRFHRIEFNWTEHVPLPIRKHTLTLGVNAAGVLGHTIDDFFDYYTGGFIGMRGYPFYAIGGNKTVSFNATYRFPISTEINFRFLQFYFKKLFGSVFCDVGDAWSGSAPSIMDWKRDVGFELRLESFSFYSYPTRIFFSGAYGLDSFSRNITFINQKSVTYGHEWRFYLGVLFGFELNDIFPRQYMR